VRSLLDEDARRRLLAIYPVHLGCRTGFVRLDLNADLVDDDVARAAVAILVDLVDRIPQAVTEADRQAAHAHAAYRDNAAAAAEIHAARADEVAKVGAVVAARNKLHDRIGIAVLVISFGLFGLFLYLCARR
jgi:hypothetical protein